MLKNYLNSLSWAFDLANWWLSKRSSSWMPLEFLSRYRPKSLQSWESIDLAPAKRHRMNKVEGNQEMETAAAKFTMQSKNYFPINPVRHQSSISCLCIKASDVCSFLLLTRCVTGCEEKHRVCTLRLISMNWKQRRNLGWLYAGSHPLIIYLHASGTSELSHWQSWMWYRLAICRRERRIFLL